MNSSECKAEALKKLNGKWGKAVLISLIYFVLFFLLGFITGFCPESIEGLLSLAVAVIEIPISFGIIISFVKLYNGEDVNVFDFFSLGFSNFAKAWKLSLNVLLKMIVPVILIIVSYIIIGIGTAMAIASAFYGSTSSVAGSSIFVLVGFVLLIVSMIWAIVKSYYYQLTYFIAIDNPDLGVKQVIEKSKELMIGNRGKLFVLQLSFIGWAVLAVITFGIGYLWLIPYMLFAMIVFYKALIGNNDKVETTIVKEESSDDEGPIKNN